MKKSLSLYDQVLAAKQNVDSWPESVKLATEIRFSDFFPAEKKASIKSDQDIPKSAENLEKV